MKFNSGLIVAVCFLAAFGIYIFSGGQTDVDPYALMKSVFDAIGFNL